MSEKSSKERERLKRVLISMVDENPDTEVKARFYSDDTVVDIMNKLYDRWESSGGQGIPLDYASDEELRVLYELALKHAGSRGSITDLLRRIFGG